MARWPWRGLAAGLALVASVAPSLPAGGPLPYRVSVEVAWGYPRGPESLRAELAGEIESALAARGCFRAIGARAEPATAADLVLVVTLDAFSDETDYETSLGERAASSDPDLTRRMVARAATDVTLALRTAAESAPVRSRRYLAEASWRPVIEEDPRAIALANLVDEIARQAAKFACRGSAPAWERDLRRARESVDPLRVPC